MFRYELAQAYHDVGIVSKGDEAVAAYRKALEIAKELPAGVPPFQEQLAAAHLSLAAHLMFRNRGAAGPHLRRAGELQAELVDDFPNRPAYRRKLGLILANVAMERAANGINSAEEWANVIAFQEGLVEDYPERSIFHNDLGATLSIRAQFLARSEERAAGTVALLERAVAENRIALEAMPRHPRYRRLLGHCQALLAREFLGRGDPRRAAEAAAAAARVEPDRWETQDHAASLLEDCIEATPNDSTRTRRYAEQAVACYERALDLAPDNAVRYRNFANFLVKGAEVSARDPRRALELTRKGLDLDPESGNLHLLRGIALVQSMRHEEALDALEKAEFGVTPYWTAQAHWHLGDKEKARAAYEEGTKLSPDDEMEALRVKTAALLGIK